MRCYRNPLSVAVRFSLTAGVVGLVGLNPLPALAQEDAAKLDRIEVTGSRIKRANIEGALPVTVITREAIDVSGDVSVADFLRNTNFNSFGSLRPQSGSSAQAVATISLRGIGAARTLVLIDGRRAPNAPSLGQGQDLNTIPLAAVERIEILSDGASAIYGSDAIGGVVNIITRKDFNGAEMTLGASNPKRAGGETEEGSVIFGASGDRGNMLAGVSYNNRGIIFARERDYSRGGLSTFSNNLFNANPNPNSPIGFNVGGFTSNPTFGSRLPGFDCDSNSFQSNATRCFYDFTSQSADEAETRNSALFARGSYQINDDWSTYFNANVSRLESFGRYAPVPSSPFPNGLPFIPVGSPNHPAVRFPNAGYDATRPYFIRHRFAALGPRDTSTDNQTYTVNVGFEGRIGEVFLDVGARRSDSQVYELGRNYVVGGLAQQAIADGTYDLYAPFNIPASVRNGLIATINRDTASLIEEVYASAETDLFDMAGGSAALAVGAEYRKESYADIYDTLQSSGQIVGSAGNSAGGSRNVRAFYAELLLPVLSSLEVSLAARHDRYSDYGNDTSPKISLRYQPIDSLALRASYGEGFRAPTLDILTQQAAFGAATVTDPLTCLSFGLPAFCQTQVTSYSIGNPNLLSEQSKQYSAGLVWDAADWISVTFDYYDIEVEDRIANIGIGTIVSCLAGLIPCPPGVNSLPASATPPIPQLGLGLARGAQGEIVYVQTGFGNQGTLDTNGIDLSIRTNFDFGDWGTLANQLAISRVGKFAFDGGRDQVDDPSVPEYRATLQTLWAYGDFSFAWNINHIDSTKSTQGLNLQFGGADYGYARRLPSWTTHDLQATWNAPWSGKIAVGVTNLADKDPVQDPFDPTGRNFDFNLYDGYGRVPYVRYTQTF